MKKVIIPLADGLEEIEAVTGIDTLRRAGIGVTTVSLDNNLQIKGDHDIYLKADKIIDNIEVDNIDGIVLPGGMPGSKNLKENKKLRELIKKVNNENGLLAAICAAPIVLEAAGVLQKKNATSYPGFEKEMPSCNYREERVVKDDNIITARGPGVALEFALTIVSTLIDEQKAEELSKQMITSEV